jgi:hypothetical protein
VLLPSLCAVILWVEERYAGDVVLGFETRRR